MLTFDSVYEHFEDMKCKFEKKLEECDDKGERRKTKSALIKLSSVKPFTAKGYFEISKQTITSMMSVR